MILVCLIVVAIVGGALSWLIGRWSSFGCRVVALMTLGLHLALGCVMLTGGYHPLGIEGDGAWLVQYDVQWIPQLGIRFHLALDGLSLWMILLTAFLGIISVAASWREIKDRVGLFHFHILLSLAGVTGVFLAVDLFLFYFFWELMLVPIFFIISLWGDRHRQEAGMKFFIFTQLGGLLMLVSILGLYFIHGRTTGYYTFDYSSLLGTPMSNVAAWWLVLGFAAAFLVKIPAIPLHTWLPRAYTSAPTAGSILLAGLLSKTGAYGLIRFAVPLFSQATEELLSLVSVLGVIGIIYGAWMAFAQTNLKRLIAYSSISHLGFILLGIAAWNQVSLQGVVMQMLAHGLSVGGLFMLAGFLQSRLQTLHLNRMGGLWVLMPRMGAIGLFFAAATMGLPGLGNFVGEFLILLGSFSSHRVITSIATAGFVFSVIYAFWMIQRIFYGPAAQGLKLPDLKIGELLTLGTLMLGLLWLGLYPGLVFKTVDQSLHVLETASGSISHASGVAFHWVGPKPIVPQGGVHEP